MSRFVRGVTGVAAGMVLLAAAGCSAQTDTGATGHNGLHVAFFGFAKANSFANATWKGVQSAAAAAGATATFFDGNFDASTQVSQIQNATVSHKYNVFVVQSNDGVAVVPAVSQAIAAGITVVAEYTPIGARNDTADPQIPGVISFVEVPTDIGTALGQLAVQACAGTNPCKVAWLVGNPTYPPDTTRRNSASDVMHTASNVDVISDTIVGGYTQATGRTAAQDLFTAHRDVNVVIGSSQAIEGAYPVAEQLGIAKDVRFIGNGGSTQALAGVESGQWFATIYEDEAHSGEVATQYGLRAAAGQKVPTSTNLLTIAPNHGLGTKAALAGVTASYTD
jgi:ribose transport system substrate-binding protein